MKKLPSLDDLIDHFDIYAHPADESLFVAGPPGSGKTSLAVHRAMFLARQGKRVVVVTRNRMLAAMARALGDDALTATTMHSHVTADFGRIPQRIAPYVYDWGWLEAAYATRGIRPTLDHLIIDEGQNLPPGFFGWARRYGARTLTVFADEDQAIDEQRSSLLDIMRAAGLGEPERLTENHRNTPEIAAVAEHFHDSRILPPALVQKGPGGETPRLLRLAATTELVQRVVTRYLNRRESIGVVVWSKADARAFYAALRGALPPEERVDVYTSDAEKGSEVGIRLLDSGITVLTGESVIGLEFDVVFLLDLRRSLPCRTLADSRRMYMLCARARDALLLVDLPPYLDSDQVAALPGPPILDR